LRRDPFELAQHNANVYDDWFLERPFVAFPVRQLLTNFVISMKLYPPSQTPASYNLTELQKLMESRSSATP
jgi:arylsulfatase